MKLFAPMGGGGCRTHDTPFGSAHERHAVIHVNNGRNNMDDISAKPPGQRCQRLPRAVPKSRLTLNNRVVVSALSRIWVWRHWLDWFLIFVGHVWWRGSDWRLSWSRVTFIVIINIWLTCCCRAILSYVV